MLSGYSAIFIRNSTSVALSGITRGSRSSTASLARYLRGYTSAKKVLPVCYTYYGLFIARLVPAEVFVRLVAPRHTSRRMGRFPQGAGTETLAWKKRDETGNEVYRSGRYLFDAFRFIEPNSPGDPRPRVAGRSSRGLSSSRRPAITAASLSACDRPLRRVNLYASTSTRDK